jgi:hypothetical protein
MDRGFEQMGKQTDHASRTKREKKKKETKNPDRRAENLKVVVDLALISQGMAHPLQNRVTERALNYLVTSHD